MVFINDKKFACATCIKGHRVSGCTHTDRPLFEVKKKGRPATQCQCCKDKRKSGNVHNKCVCGDAKGPEVILPPGHPGLDPDSNPFGAGPSGTSTEDEDHDMAELSTSAAKGKGKGKRRETKKGRPGDQATFPNGLRDVHEMAAAAEVLTELNEDPMQRVERTVASLLNPCSCKHTGICKCCEPKRAPRNRRSIAHSRSPSASGSILGDRGRRDSTDNLIQLFKSRAPSPSPYGSTASSPNPSPISPAGGRYSGNSTLPVPGVTVENTHHPAHTSRRVHKTKLYSPYSNEDSGHRRRNSASRRSISGSSVKSLRLRPLADMNRFLSAALNPDGTTATEINRSAVGLPGIASFDEMARKAGVKVEPMDEMDVDSDEPLAFPTQEDVVLGACTCGENCDCPGCATHSNGGASGTHECGTNCRSHFDCGAEVSVPSGIISIDQLLSVAASAVPKPVRHRPLDQLAMDTSLLPPSAAFSPDAAAGLGVVDLKPLQCCNGRCQCTPGTCGCKDDCCGCCVRCACAEDAPTPTQDNPAPMAAAQAEGSGSCCGGTGNARQSLSIATNPMGMGMNVTPPRLSPNSAAGTSGHPFNMSPLHSPLIQPTQQQAHQHRHSLSSSSLPSPMMGPSSPGLLQPVAPGSSSGSGSSCCSPASGAAPLLQVNTSSQHSPFGSPAHSPAAEQYYRLPSPSLGQGPMLDTSIQSIPGPNSAPGSFDPAQGIRRASSPAHVVASMMPGQPAPISGPVYGHSHSQSLSAGTGRRSTITGGSGIHRSASTGKQASKALALNQQANHAGQHMHVRPILPKPNAAATAALLAPPNRQGNTSRPTSPSGRRRSSSSLSRAPSPGPSGGNGAGRSVSHQHRASESAIGSMQGQQDMMPLPMVTTSAPGETRQEVSFDPNEDNRDSSEERSDPEQEQQQQHQQQGRAPMVPLQITPELAQMFQAWLVQNGHVRSPPQQHTQTPDRGQVQVSPTGMPGPSGTPGQFFGGGMDQQFSPTGQVPFANPFFGPSNVSAHHSHTNDYQQQQQHASQVPDFGGFSFDPNQYASSSSQYLQQAMLELNNSMSAGMNGNTGGSGQGQGQGHSQGGNDNNTIAQPFDVFAAMQAQMMQNHGQQPIPLDQAQQQYMQFQAQYQVPDMGMAMSGPPNMSMPHPMQSQHQHQQQHGEQAGFFGGVPGMQAPMGHQGQGVGQWQMPLHQQAAPSHMQQQQQQQGPSTGHESPLHIQQVGNMIDLSKPLDSTDVDRIIKALQEQQNRQAQLSQSQQQPQPPQVQQQQQQRPSSSQGFGMPPPHVPPPRLGQGHGHSLSHNNIGTQATGSGVGTPGQTQNIFGFGSASASASGSSTQLSSSAPQSQSSGFLHSQHDVGSGSQMPSFDQNQAQALGMGLGMGMYGNNAPSGMSLSAQHTPSFSISSFDSLLAPPSSESSGSGVLSGRTSFTLETDKDVFEQFIMENAGEGFDLSALDLGTAAMGDADGMGGGVGMGIDMDGQGSQGKVRETGQGGVGVGVGVSGDGQAANAQDGQQGLDRAEGETEMGGDEAILSQYTFF